MQGYRAAGRRQDATGNPGMEMEGAIGGIDGQMNEAGAAKEMGDFNGCRAHQGLAIRAVGGRGGVEGNALGTDQNFGTAAIETGGGSQGAEWGGDEAV